MTLGIITLSSDILYKLRC